MTASGASFPAVRITGMGIVSSIGHDVAAFGQSLAAGKSGIRRLARETAPPLAVPIGAEIEDFSYPTALRAVSDLPDALQDAAARGARRASFPVQASVIAALQAWGQARLHVGAIAPERIGLVVAGHNTTQSYQYTLAPEFLENPEYLSPRYAVQVMDSNQVGVLSEIFGIKGEGFVTGGASASGNVGVIQAARLIRAGLADACLVVGVVADLSPMEMQGFHALGAMGGKRFRDHPEKACRPFDSQHEGFIYGQAAACLVLEAADSADARGVASLAAILGGAIRLHATSSPSPDLDGEAEAMRAALHQSGVAASDIDYLNTHGTSSPLGDRTEIAAIEQVFGDHLPNVWLNATKGLTGHCLNSAGVVEIIATVIQTNQEFIHPNLNLDDPIHGAARFCGATAVRQPIHVAMSNALGSAGSTPASCCAAHEPCDHQAAPRAAGLHHYDRSRRCEQRHQPDPGGGISTGADRLRSGLTVHVVVIEARPRSSLSAPTSTTTPRTPERNAVDPDALYEVWERLTSVRSSASRRCAARRTPAGLALRPPAISCWRTARRNSACRSCCSASIRPACCHS